jgi:membrane fusion protein
MFNLYRKEAIEHQSHKLIGSIVIPRSVSFDLFVIASVASAATIIAFIVFASFSRTETVNGVIVPERGVVRLFPPQMGIVSSVFVKDGQHVSLGMPLLDISGERGTSLGEDTQAGISRLLQERISKLGVEANSHRQQTIRQMSALKGRETQIAEEILQILQEQSLQSKRVELAEATHRRFQDLKQSNFISDAQLQDKLAEVLEQKAKLQSLIRAKAGLDRDMLSVQTEIGEYPHRSSRELSAIERGAAEIRQDLAESEARRKVTVRSPIDGFVAALNVSLGQSTTSQPLMSMIPMGDKLEAEVYAPSRSMGFVRSGTDVTIRYQAFPYQKFGQFRGTVREVSIATLQPSEIQGLGSREQLSGEPLYKIRVALKEQNINAYGLERPLTVGMQLQASLKLEERRLYEWILEPLQSISVRP